MCGVAGILSYRTGDRIAPSELEAMAGAMVHRGPDAGGSWRSDRFPLGLASRRLRVVDPDPRADQPLSNEDGSVQLCFNGEIFNQAALRETLIAAGHRFRTDHSDTEVIVHGYEEWGRDELLRRLDGMFAFALWDDSNGRLILARDRLGIKPLYLAQDRNRVLFASEIKAILPVRSAAADIEPLALHHYLTFHVVPAPLTLFKGIWKLPAGCVLELDAGSGARCERYWRPMPGNGIDPKQVAGMGPEERVSFYAGGVRTRLEAAVEKQLAADCPVGVLLSGGVDSTTNVALMSERLGKPVETFTVGYEGFEAPNEFEQAEAVASHFGTNHHVIAIGAKDMEACVEAIVYHQDEPLADNVCLPLYHVSKLIHDNGLRVVQVGEGADELFAGYDGYLSYLRFYEKYWRTPVRQILSGPLSGAGRLARRFISSDWQHIDIMERALAGQEPFWSGAIAFGEMRKRAILAGRQTGAVTVPFDLPGGAFCSTGELDSFRPIAELLDDLPKMYGDPLTRMIWLELHLRLPELLLMRADKMTMAHSVEARVPFLDHALVEFAMGIPQRFKVMGGQPKHILKRAVRGLVPDFVLDRPKVGFGAPIAEWLRGPFGVQVENDICNGGLAGRGIFEPTAVRRMIETHRRGERDRSVEIWTLFNLSKWYERWIES